MYNSRLGALRNDIGGNYLSSYTTFLSEGLRIQASACLLSSTQRRGSAAVCFLSFLRFREIRNGTKATVTGQYSQNRKP